MKIQHQLVEVQKCLMVQPILFTGQKLDMKLPSYKNIFLFVMLCWKLLKLKRKEKKTLFHTERKCKQETKSIKSQNN